MITWMGSVVVKKYLKIILIILFILIIASILFYIYMISKNSNDFSRLYKNVKKDNVYKKISAKEMIDIIENKTGIIYIGYPNCPWCRALVPILNEVAKEDEIENIYYIDNFYNMRPDKNKNPENSKEYNRLVNLLGDEIVETKSNANEFNIIRVPLVLFIKNGEIIDYHMGTYKGHILKEKTDKNGNKVKYLEELTESQKQEIKKVLDEKIRKVYSNKCSESSC